MTTQKPSNPARKGGAGPTVARIKWVSAGVFAGAMILVSALLPDRESTDVFRIDQPPGTYLPAPSLTPSPVIEEDDPRWDCHTMGNRICGPTR